MRGKVEKLNGVRGKEKAFTLIEVMVAGIILAFLLVGVYFIFEKTHSSWEKGNTRLTQYQKARGCLDIISRELKSTFITLSNPSIVFKGERQRLLFTCSSNTPDKKGEYDLKEVEYKLKNHELVRRVKTNFNDPSNPGATITLASGIIDLSFSYYNGAIWQNNWDSTRDRTSLSSLPEAVKVEMVIKGENSSSLTFSTIVNIPVK